MALTTDLPRLSSDNDSAARARPPAVPADAGSALPSCGSGAIVDSVRRIDEFVVRYLDVARCGLWSVWPGDAARAICVDVFVRNLGLHRREVDRAGADLWAMHRRLESAGPLCVGADEVELLPAGASAALLMPVRRGGRLVAYLCAEQTGEPRPWTAEDQLFMRSMSDVVREVFALAGVSAAPGAGASLFEHLPVVAYRGTLIGDEWMLTVVSEGAERLLGRRAAQLVGQPIGALREGLAEAPPPLPADGDFEHQYQRSTSGAVRRFTEQGCVAVDPAGGASVVEGLITETTARHDPPPDIAAQFELLSHVSHELRTPLNAILGFAQLIELDAAGSTVQRHEYVTQIQRAGRHLLEVIRETMDLTRLQAGPLELQLEALPLMKVIEDSLPMVTNQAKQACVHLVNAVRDPRIMVVADPRPLSQALVNLLSNAIKYNRAGGSVYVECDMQDEAVRLRVTDTGIGLSAHQTEALFQPFNRLGMERSEIEGVGLGLVITRRLIEAMGGQIAVTSHAGVGSTFQVTLPRHRPP